MRKSLFMTVLAMGILSSCQNNMENVMETTLSNSTVVVNASLDLNAESRTTLTEESTDVFKILWSAEDKLGIFYYSSTAHNKFKLTNGAGESNAEFENDGPFKVTSGTESGNASNFACVGYYPYDENTTATINSDGSYTIGTAIAVNQAYATNSFGTDNFPMVAVSDNLNFSFKNVASVLRMPLKGTAKIVKATLTSQSNKIAGPYSVKMAEVDGTWTPSIDGEGLGITDGGSSMIVLECAEPVQLQTNTATNFLFVIPPVTYAANDLIIKFYDNEGKYYSTTITAENTFARSEVKTFNERTYENPQNVGIAEANDALEAGIENVDVTIASTDQDPTLELPATTSENPTNINFETIPEGTVVKIQASTESNNQEAKNVNLSVPESQTGYSFDINLPNSTVTLGANDGESVTYNEVTAATADNTLIIATGVTVNTLKAKQGHIRVYGKLSAIERTDDHKYGENVTYIIKEEGAEIPETPGEGFKVVSAAEYDFLKALESEDSYTLESNLTVNETLTIPSDKTFELNLNNNTLKIEGSSISYGLINKGQMTIKNGTIDFTGNGANGAAVCNMSKIQLESVNVTSNSVCFRNWGDATVKKLDGKTVSDATVTAVINGGTFTSSFSNTESHKEHRYAVHGYFLSNMTMTGSTVTGSGGIHVDVSFAKLTNVTATANCQYGAHDLYVAAGNATVSGCTFNNMAAYSDDEYGKAVVNGTTYENGTTGIGNIANKEALTNAFTKGGSYILTADVTVESKLSLGSGNMILDLGGKTLKIEGSSISYGLINKGNMTIKNGTVDFVGDGTNGAAVCNMSQIELENVNVTSNTVCFRNWGDATVKKLDGKTVSDATVTAVINGGTFTSSFSNTESHKEHRYAVHGYFLSNMTMTGSTITGSGSIHVDVSFATLTDVTATANCQYGAHDLYVAAGNATVTECTFANAAAYSDATYGNAVVNNKTYQHDTNNTNGTTIAIDLGQN